MTSSSNDAGQRTLSPKQLLAWAEGGAHAARLRTFRDVIPQGFMAALAPAIVDWQRSSPFEDDPFVVLRNVNYGGNPLEKTINLQQVHVPLTGVAFAEFILVPSTRGGQHALAHHAQLRFVFEPESRPVLLDLADSPVGSASRIPDLVLSWETWHESSVRYSGFKGLDPSSYRLSMRAYAGPQRYLEDTLRGRPWLAYRLRIPGGMQGATELLKVVLAIGDGVARDTISQLLELGEEGWAQNTPPADADPAAKAEWQRLRELAKQRHKVGDNRLVLSNEQQGYQTLVRSCATLARYTVLTAAKRMIHRGCEDGVNEDKVPEPLMSEPAEWMKAVAHTNLWGLFVRAPLALAYIIRNPSAVPEKIPHELAAAGLIERRDGKAWMMKYAHHENSPYDRSGMYGRDYLD
jgi:hypothetical protein